MDYFKEKTKYILITGCSSGIGYETAEYLKDKKFNIIASSRKIIDVNLCIKMIQPIHLWV